MIIEGGHVITSVRFLSLAITKIKKGTKLIWSLITSCFGSGIWSDINNWVDSDYWKD